MVTIVGGELLCSLGDRAQRVKALREGEPKIGTIMVKVGGTEVSCPYYRIDETLRFSSASIVDGYLDRVVSSLLEKIELKPASLSNVGLFLGASSIDYSMAWPIEEAVDDAFVKSCKRERVGGGNYLESLMRRFAFDGPSLTFNNACTTFGNNIQNTI